MYKIGLPIKINLYKFQINEKLRPFYEIKFMLIIIVIIMIIIKIRIEYNSN